MTSAHSDLSASLRDLLRRAEARYPDQAHRVWEVWESAVGPEVARRSSPVSLQGGRLLVAVSTSAWVQQLSFLRERLREALNQALGQNVVRDIRFRLAEWEPPLPAREPAPPPPWLSDPLDAATLERLREEVAGISDDAVRHAVLAARVRAEQVRRFREGRAGDRPPRRTEPPARGE